MDLGYRPPHNLFEAARKHYTIKVTCKACGHWHIFDGHALWFLFERRFWDSRLREIGRRLWCSRCWQRAQKKVKLPKVEPVKDDPTGPQPQMPDEGTWKRELRRHRT